MVKEYIKTFTVTEHIKLPNSISEAATIANNRIPKLSTSQKKSLFDEEYCFIRLLTTYEFLGMTFPHAWDYSIEYGKITCKPFWLKEEIINANPNQKDEIFLFYIWSNIFHPNSKNEPSSELPAQSREIMNLLNECNEGVSILFSEQILNSPEWEKDKLDSKIMKYAPMFYWLGRTREMHLQKDVIDAGLKAINKKASNKLKGAITTKEKAEINFVTNFVIAGYLLSENNNYSQIELLEALKENGRKIEISTLKRYVSEWGDYETFKKYAVILYNYNKELPLKQ